MEKFIKTLNEKLSEFKKLSEEEKRKYLEDKKAEDVRRAEESNIYSSNSNEAKTISA